MNRTALGLAAILVAVALTAAADVLGQVGVSEDAAKEEVLTGFSGGFVNHTLAARAFKAASAPIRAQLAQGVITWARAYTSSAQFKKAYAEMRESRKPQPPTYDNTPEEQLERQRAEQQKSSEEMKQAVAGMAAEQRAQMEEAVKQAAAAMAQMDTPEMRKMQLDGIRMEREGDMQSYKNSLERWQEDFPEQPAPLIAKRLRAFLEASADVDYAAALEEKDGKMRFVNQAYESKPAQWKLCYRTGKEAVTAARTAAQAWLTELGTP